MDHTTQGIILRIHPFSETSLIVRWLTPDHGRVGTIARGALRPKSPMRGRLDLFHLAQISFAQARRSNLHTLREVSLIETHSALRQGLDPLQQASYAARLLEQVTESDTPLPEIFALFRGFLEVTDRSVSPPVHVLAFEARMLAVSGLLPQSDKLTIVPETRSILGQLLEDPWAIISRLRPSPIQFNALEILLGDLLLENWDRLPASRPAALHPLDPLVQFK